MDYISKNIFEENGKYYTKAVETVDFSNEEAELSFYKEIYELLNEDEISIIYDVSEEADGFAFINYKHQGKLVVDEAFFEKDIYNIYVDLSMWMYPEMKELTLKERVALYDKLTEWKEETGVPLDIYGFEREKNPKRLLEQSDKDQIILSKEQEKKVILFSNLAQYGLLSLIAIIPIVYLGISGATSVPFYLIGIGLIIYGGYLIIGVLMKYRHVYCIFQSLSKKKKTPNEVYWNTLSKTDLYGVPLIMIVLGLITIVGYFIF